MKGSMFHDYNAKKVFFQYYNEMEEPENHKFAQALKDLYETIVMSEDDERRIFKVTNLDVENLYAKF